MVEDKSFSSRCFTGLNYLALLLFALVTVIPFLYVVVGSFTAPEELVEKGFVLIPTKLSFSAYRYIFSTNTLLQGLTNSVLITVIGTLVNLLFTSLMAYPLARKDMLGRRPIMMMVVFSMLFSGGMIPTFLVIKALGLLNSYGALIIPNAISAFNLIILKNFFQQTPEGLEESAKLDGCGNFGILFRIVLPLSMPALATFALFYSVGHWNTFFSAIMYINDSGKWPVQVLLRQIVILSQGGIGDSAQIGDSFVPPAQTIKMATIVASTLPILIVYPFLQKHFAKGALLGSVKG